MEKSLEEVFQPEQPRGLRQMVAKERAPGERVDLLDVAFVDGVIVAQIHIVGYPDRVGAVLADPCSLFLLGFHKHYFLDGFTFFAGISSGVA